MTFYLDHEKPKLLSFSDLLHLETELRKFNYNITRQDLQKIARKKRSVFLREQTTDAARAYAELQVREKMVTIEWLFAPKLGETMVRAIVDHVQVNIPKAENIKLIVEVDKSESDVEKMTKARMNLYFKCGFTIEKVKFVKNVAVYVMVLPIKK